jgi:hypothetical protein
MHLTTCSALALALLAGAPAAAQSLSPMRREVVSFEDRFALRVMAGNPNDRSQTIAVRVFDLDWTELGDAWVSRPATDVPPGGRVDVIVIAPFHGESVRDVRICAEAAPAPYAGTGVSARVRGQVCGLFRARRVS